MTFGPNPDHSLKSFSGAARATQRSYIHKEYTPPIFDWNNKGNIEETLIPSGPEQSCARPIDSMVWRKTVLNFFALIAEWYRA